MAVEINIHENRYERRGECCQCGWCCDNEDCEYLHYVDDKAICIIHPILIGVEIRPPKCENFPQAPPILNPRCGFHFVDVWEDLRIVKCGEL